MSDRIPVLPQYGFAAVPLVLAGMILGIIYVILINILIWRLKTPKLKIDYNSNWAKWLLQTFFYRYGILAYVFSSEATRVDDAFSRILVVMTRIVFTLGFLSLVGGAVVVVLAAIQMSGR